MYHPAIWYTLFSIINCCMTSKSTRLDSCNILVLRIFHDIVLNKSVSWIATSTIGSHVLRSDIETDIIDLVTHAQAPPIHSTIFQKIFILSSDIDIAHTLSGSLSKIVDIEIGGHQLPNVYSNHIESRVVTL